nr:BLUF domain-containing protein [Massilia sp. TS11]
MRLVYLSSATRELTKSELLDLLEAARENNARLGITGLLLYKGGNFMQVLEGEPEAVRTLYRKIVRDARHTGPMLIIEEPADTRFFEGWGMGFRDLDDPELHNTPGYSHYMNLGRDRSPTRADHSGVHELIEMFRSGR